MDFTQIQSAVYPYLFSFIDLIKGIIPFCLTDALKQQGLSSSQVSLTIRTLLEYVQSSYWSLIWSPRYTKFKEFLQANNITLDREFNRANHTRSLIGSSQCSITVCWTRSKLRHVDRLIDRSKFIILAKISDIWHGILTTT